MAARGKPLLSRRILIGAVAAPFLPCPAFANDLGRLVGPLLMFGFAGRSVAAPDAAWIARQLARGDIGGVCFLGHNFGTKTGVEGLTALFNAAPRQRPALLALDQEGGAVQRLSARTGYRDWPGAARMARGGHDAVDQYTAMAQMVRQAGFNLNFGPVVDLATQKSSPIIAQQGRSYGDSGAEVARLAAIFCRVHRAARVLTTLKHFPGHGGARRDSHKGAADVTAKWSDDDLLPYRLLAQAGDGDLVMTGHLGHADLGGADLPTSLSRDVVTGVLKTAIGWQGPVITDDLDMVPIRALHTPAEAAVAALAAGNDIALISNTVKPDSSLAPRIVAAMRMALAEGRLTLARLEDANDRIDKMLARLAR